jgi:hypothetical protein
MFMLERYYISLNWYKLADVLELTIFTDDPILPARQAHIITPRPKYWHRWNHSE